MRIIPLLPLFALLACGGPAPQNTVDAAATDSTKRTSQPALAKPAPLHEGHNVVPSVSGRPALEGDIHDGKRDGTWTSYTEQGGTKSRNVYVHGVLEGPTIVYFDNGKVRYTGQHHKDKPVGEWKFYDETGTLTKTTVYDSTGVVARPH